jgi:hypothetical protein
MSLIRKLGFVYFALFVIVAAMSYVPQFKDANGMMFGLFSLDLYDDALHLFSGIWAGIAAWLSTRATVTYFKLFGTLYFLDGLLGLVTGSGYLDLGILYYGVQNLPLGFKILANLPHLALGGFAMLAGFLLAKRPGFAA